MREALLGLLGRVSALDEERERDDTSGVAGEVLILGLPNKRNLPMGEGDGSRSEVSGTVEKNGFELKNTLCGL